jgi:hypothetical protein
MSSPGAKGLKYTIKVPWRPAYKVQGLLQYTVKPLSIAPVTVVGPHVSFALFGPEISPI